MVRTSLAVAAATLLTAAPVSAAPVSGGTPLILPSSAHVQLADWNVRHHRWVYNPRIYGPRFAYRHGPYRYYYGGWWYARPWWGTAPVAGFAVAPEVVEPGYTVVEPGYTVVEPEEYVEPGYTVVEPEYGD